MKAKELMIGDWVSVKSCPNPNFYKISKLDPYMESSVYPIHVERPAEGLSYTFLDEDEIEPIPITEEILKKNGFSKIGTIGDNYIHCIANDSCYCEIEINLHDNTLCVNNTWVRANNIRYVHELQHELQHALRLCNIDKEIEL